MVGTQPLKDISGNDTTKTKKSASTNANDDGPAKRTRSATGKLPPKKTLADIVGSTEDLQANNTVDGDVKAKKLKKMETAPPKITIPGDELNIEQEDHTSAGKERKRKSPVAAKKKPASPKASPALKANDPSTPKPSTSPKTSPKLRGAAAKKKRAAEEAEVERKAALAALYLAKKPQYPTCGRCAGRIKLLDHPVPVVAPTDSLNEDVEGEVGDEQTTTTGVEPPKLKKKPSAPQQTVQCPHCSRYYHKRCFLLETSVVPTFQPNDQVDDAVEFNGCSLKTTNPCTCCISGVVEPELLAVNKSSVSNTVEDESFEQVVNRHTATFLHDGFCVIPLALPSCLKTQKEHDGDEIVDGHLDDATQSQLKELHDKILKYHQALLSTYEMELESGATMPSLAQGFANFRERGEGRFEITKTPFIQEALVPLLEEHPVVKAVLRKSLNCPPTTSSENDKEPLRMSSGCFLAMPGAKCQNLHTDGPALSVTENLNPYAINVFLPLVDVGPHNGTEFYPATQLQRSVDEETGENLDVFPGPKVHLEDILDAVSGRPRVSPHIKVGNVLLFDYRVVHRGLGNRGAFPRPNCYITYSQPWYKDVFNFGSTRYNKTLQVSEHLLTSRGDRLNERLKSAQQLAAQEQQQ